MKRQKRIALFLILIVCGLAGASGGPRQSDATPKYPAKLCSDCGFGSKKDHCVRCDKWVGSADIPARLCSNCGFGSKKDHCVRCGKWIGSTDIDAKLCSSCGFGSKKQNCVKCGRHSFD